MAYLNINDHKIGEPPDWRDARFWTKTFWRGNVFNRSRYIRAVENYIIQMHQRLWETICQYDKMSQERGEKSIYMNKLLNQLLPVYKIIGEWEDRYTLTPEEFKSKYGESDED